MKENIIGAMAVIALIGVIWLATTKGPSLVSNGSSNLGATAATGMLAENYIPFVLYNNGYNSAKDVATTGGLYGATITSTGTFTQTTANAATTTAALGCIQTTATSTATPIRFVIGSTVQSTSTYQGTVSQGEVAWQYGTCPI